MGKGGGTPKKILGGDWGGGGHLLPETLTLVSKPVRNLRSRDFCSTLARSPSAAARITWGWRRSRGGTAWSWGGGGGCAEYTHTTTPPYLDIVIRELLVERAACPKIQQSHLKRCGGGIWMLRGPIGSKGLIFGHGGLYSVPPLLPNAHPVPVSVVKKICPVWIRLHEAKFEKFPQAKAQEVGADLGEGTEELGELGGWAQRAFPPPTKKPKHLGLTHLVSQGLREIPALVEGDTTPQLHGKDTGRRQLIHDPRHREKGVVP